MSNIDTDITKINKVLDACEALRKMQGYPYIEEKDLPFVRDLLEEFPSLDLVEQIKQWQIWLLDNQEKIGKGKKKINFRARLRRWCSNTSKWQKNRQIYCKPRQGGKTIAQYEFEKERPNDLTKFEEVW